MSRPKKKPKPLVTPAIIRRVVKTIVREFQPEKIILFGSQARGKPHWDSDLDLLIIGPSRLKPRERVFQVRRTLLPSPCPLDIFYYTPEEVAIWSQVKFSWLNMMQEEGKTIYGPKKT